MHSSGNDRHSKPHQHPVMVTIKVEERDTITSLAAFHHCRPAEIAAANRLSTRQLFPGQVLRVPSRRPTPVPQTETPQGLAHPSFAVHGAVINEAARPDPMLTSSEGHRGQPAAQYVRIETRLITPGRGAPFGTLLVTPNRLTFEPHVSDPLVVAVGLEAYFVTLPVTSLQRVSSFRDIAHVDAYRRYVTSGELDRPETSPINSSRAIPFMSQPQRSGETADSVSPIEMSSPNEPEVISLPASETSSATVSPAAARNTAFSTSTIDDAGVGVAGGSHQSVLRPEGFSCPPAVSEVRTSSQQEVRGSQPVGIPGAGGEETSSGSAAADAPGPVSRGRKLSGTIPFVTLLSGHGSWMNSASGSSFRSRYPSYSHQASWSSAADADVFAAVPGADPKRISENGETSKWTADDERPRKRVRYKSVVSIDERPSLFTPCDELLACPDPGPDDPALYLRLVTQVRLDLPLSASSSLRVCGRSRLPSQLWFSAAPSCVDRLWRFLQQWTPEVCLDEHTDTSGIHADTQPDSDSDFWEPEEDWAMLDATSGLENLKQPEGVAGELVAAPGGVDLAVEGGMARLPELIGKSDLLTEGHMAALYRELPPRVEGHPWTLAFSTTEDGFSLKTLYRKSKQFQCPMLLVVQDNRNQTFGAVTSDPIRMGPHFYGTGETFLFRLQPEFRMFGWSGENNFFMRGSLDGLEFGSGEGHPGLFVDEGLYRGRTERCPTFENEPLAESRDFLIHGVELWALG